MKSSFQLHGQTRVSQEPPMSFTGASWQPPGALVGHSLQGQEAPGSPKKTLRRTPAGLGEPTGSHGHPRGAREPPKAYIGHHALGTLVEFSAFIMLCGACLIFFVGYLYLNKTCADAVHLVHSNGSVQLRWRMAHQRGAGAVVTVSCWGLRGGGQETTTRRWRKGRRRTRGRRSGLRDGNEEE